MSTPDDPSETRESPQAVPSSLSSDTLKRLLPKPSRRTLFLSVWGLIVVSVLVATRAVLLPFFLALVVAYVFSPVVAWVQGRKPFGKAIPRWLAVVMLYATLLIGLGGFIAVGVPRLAAEVELLASELPETVAQARDEWVPALETWLRDAMRDSTDEAPSELGGPPREEVPGDVIAAALAPDVREHIEVRPSEDGLGYRVDLPEHGLVIEPMGHGYRVTASEIDASDEGDLSQALSDALESMASDTRTTASAVLTTAQSVVRALVKGIFTFFIMLMLSAYMLVTSDRILAFFRSLWTVKRRRSFDRLVLRIDRGMAGVVRGQLLIALVNGALSGVGFYFLDLRYWPILTLIATLLSVIPIFGAIISTVPAVIIALQSGLSTAAFTLAWIFVIHQIEANLLNPKIMGDSAKVHPVLVIFALLAGEAVAGIAGALLAVPALSIVQSLFLHYREVMLGVPKKADASVSDV
ncbi:MAG: putative PurR-regulated permease PerM [Polyangiales bacterium]|jgi:predicted PurR-regulated permease PerM